MLRGVLMVVFTFTRLTLTQMNSGTNLSESAESKFLPVKYTGGHMRIETVQGMLANLPCNITSDMPSDKIQLVLWYKDREGKPIFTFDLRKISLSTHTSLQATIIGSEDTKGRAEFNLDGKPAFLSLHGVLDSDAGDYSCRVDYKLAPTRYQAISLIVIVPPSRAIIHDVYGNQFNQVLGPFQLNTSVVLVCDILGGNPESKATWWKNGKLLDSSWKRIAAGKSRNLLELYIREDMQNNLLECRGSNNNRTNPVSRKGKLEILVPPKEISLSYVPAQISVGNEYRLECHAKGGHPTPTLKWKFSDGSRPSGNVDVATTKGSETLSTLDYSPKPSDQGKVLECIAENEAVNSTIYTSVHLNVSYVPAVVLKLGSNIKGNIEEGDDVYLSCIIQAFPPVYKNIWYFQGEAISTGGELFSFHDNNLVIRNISSSSAGEYSCSATNIEGSGRSNVITINVTYVPKCEAKKATKVVRKGDRKVYSCPINANPSATNYRWSFESGGVVKNLVTKSKTPNIQFIPSSDSDFGTLICWAENSIGIQERPCLIQLVPSASPDTVVDCSTNITDQSVVINCLPAVDSSKTEHYMLRLSLSADNKFTRIEFLNDNEPVFVVRDLPPGARVKASVVSVNRHGESLPAQLLLHIPQTNTIEKRISERSVGKETIWIVFALVSTLILILLILGILTRIFIIHLCNKKKNVTLQQQSEAQQPQPQQQQNQQLDLFGMGSSDASSLQISSAPSQTSKSMFILDQGRSRVPQFFTFLEEAPCSGDTGCSGTTRFFTQPRCRHVGFQSPFYTLPNQRKPAVSAVAYSQQHLSKPVVSYSHQLSQDELDSPSLQRSSPKEVHREVNGVTKRGSLTMLPSQINALNSNKQQSNNTKEIDIRL